MIPILCVNVDLDPLRCYYEIHGLAQPPSEKKDLLQCQAPLRFQALFSRLKIKATFFVVGKDLKELKFREVIKSLLEDGHEIGNHTFTHPYNLTRLAPKKIEEEIFMTDQIIKEITNIKPYGFRAPGYGINNQILKTVRQMGYLYDSSILPSFLYYLIKLLKLGTIYLRGKKSGAQIIDPRSLISPNYPYFIQDSFWEAGTKKQNLIEFPITTLPILQIPFIGTFLTLLGEKNSLFLCALMQKHFVNLEFHGIDLIAPEIDPISSELVSLQPGLKLELNKKMKIIESVISKLLETHKPMTLKDAAQFFQQNKKYNLFF